MNVDSGLRMESFAQIIAEIIGLEKYRRLRGDILRWKTVPRCLVTSKNSHTITGIILTMQNNTWNCGRLGNGRCWNKADKLFVILSDRTFRQENRMGCNYTNALIRPFNVCYKWHKAGQKVERPAVKGVQNFRAIPLYTIGNLVRKT